MKYGESAFDILYLLLAVICGILIIRRARGKTGKLMGMAALILGLGDAFHLVPRVLNYFVDADLTAALGIGKLITSITMTIFYVLLYSVWAGCFHVEKDKRITAAVWILAAVRILLCLFPQNGWLANESGMKWGILRNVPFAALGALIIVLYYQKRNVSRRFRYIWLYILLSFLFYLPVAVGAGAIPLLGMLMLPKTVCYILMICTFYSAAAKGETDL